MYAAWANIEASDIEPTDRWMPVSAVVAETLFPLAGGGDLDPSAPLLSWGFWIQAPDRRTVHCLSVRASDGGTKVLCIRQRCISDERLSTQRCASHVSARERCCCCGRAEMRAIPFHPCLVVPAGKAVGMEPGTGLGRPVRETQEQMAIAQRHLTTY